MCGRGWGGGRGGVGDNGNGREWGYIVLYICMGCGQYAAQFAISGETLSLVTITVIFKFSELYNY